MINTRLYNVLINLNCPSNTTTSEKKNTPLCPASPFFKSLEVCVGEVAEGESLLVVWE